MRHVITASYEGKRQVNDFDPLDLHSAANFVTITQRMKQIIWILPAALMERPWRLPRRPRLAIPLRAGLAASATNG